MFLVGDMEMIWYVVCGDVAGDDGVDAAEVSWFWSTECETSEVQHFFHHSFFLQLVWKDTDSCFKEHQISVWMWEDIKTYFGTNNLLKLLKPSGDWFSTEKGENYKCVTLWSKIFSDFQQFAELFAAFSWKPPQAENMTMTWKKKNQFV